ncbi:glutathione S-transferase family protein [Pseudofulvimonas gallinarii]|jgi:glutathione S-transferase|uniref:Glutathione S-transferase n=1 Tax=Pseudofulvimonas gallinarii TaxID=634155 RepID=A0A4R3LGY4_9GAMM|nr:glutathione S-transferase N-terminal domain-containing protein [Pseudofulvimonas gallinarii]TCS99292.1 glutathione S-transferase [Pseudofulvimonas gallinarii]THD13910.1 glutathione S-transferase [Pseudofulvimonas gallinarii]
MKLYYMPGACSLATHIVLEWIGQPYEAVKVPRDQLKSPEFLAINPAGAVPAFADGDGWVLTQNAAIMAYLADTYPQAGLAGDGTARSRAEVNRWMGLLNADLHKAFVPIFAPAKYIADESQHDAVKDAARTNVRALLKGIDAHLADHRWLANDQRSYVDPYLYVMLRWAKGVGVDLSGLDNLAGFSARMESDEAVRKALAAEGLA